MKDKFTLVQECLTASRYHEANLTQLFLKFPNSVVHNTIEGLRMTQDKLREVLLQRTVTVAAYSTKGRFLGYRRVQIGDFDGLPIATADSKDIEVIMKRIKPEHQDWEFRQFSDKVVLGLSARLLSGAWTI